MDCFIVFIFGCICWFRHWRDLWCPPGTMTTAPFCWTWTWRRRATLSVLNSVSLPVPLALFILFLEKVLPGHRTPCGQRYIMHARPALKDLRHRPRPLCLKVAYHVTSSISHQLQGCGSKETRPWATKTNHGKSHFCGCSLLPVEHRAECLMPRASGPAVL